MNGLKLIVAQGLGQGGQKVVDRVVDSYSLLAGEAEGLVDRHEARTVEDHTTMEQLGQLRRRSPRQISH